MSAPWWALAQPDAAAALGADGLRPQLQPATRQAVADSLKARIAAYTPEWTRRSAGDAGMALVRLHAEQMEGVLQRLNRLPDKALVELLGIGGVAPLAARPARALLQFEVAEKAPQSVLVAQGFQCSARSQGELVIFETERALYASGAPLASLQVESKGNLREVDAEGLYPFGERGDGRLLIGLAGTADIGPRLSIGLQIATEQGSPPPTSVGGLQAPAAAGSPLLSWDVLDGGSPQPAAVVVDETRGLVQSGTVELDLPARWRPSVLAAGAKPLRWLRLSIAHGKYAKPPRVEALRLNCVMATAARTVFGEVLQEVAGSEGRAWRVAQTPVIAGSLELEVDEGDQADAAGASAIADEANQDAAAPAASWREVDSLVDAGPEARVYAFDPTSGVVSFGDGRRGAAAPRGFRHIRAVRYRVGSGAAGAVPAKAIGTMINSVAWLTGVSNPLPASGGVDVEPQAQAVARGPQELRARGRAVTVADYALLATRAPGAAISRAHAVAGLHPAFPGRPRPGVVTVFVVPADGPGHPLVPNGEALAAVAGYLGEAVAPAGVEVVAAAPRYHRVRVETGLVLGASVSASEIVSKVLEELDRYFDARVGGRDRQGWPFGGPIVYTELVQRVSKVNGVHAVHHLNLVVDGTRTLACQDFVISPQGLLVPASHEIAIIAREAA